MRHSCVFVLLLWIYFVGFCVCDDDHFDFLIFTQHWPATVCKLWQEKKPNNTCSFPTTPDIWTIHGIWPSRIGSEGPNFCNNQLHFNASALEPIESDLSNYWVNIEKNTPLTSMWKHEWLKHGTCLVTLSDLQDEYKYFSKGLEWIKQYQMEQILSNAGIVPSLTQGYSVQSISDAVRTAFGVLPRIECAIEKHGVSFISEIRLCFNKLLVLDDCPSVGPSASDMLNTNCVVDKPVGYPPPPDANYNLVQLYKLTQFLLWATL